MELSELRMAIYKSNFTSEEYNGLIDIIQETQTMNAKAKISVGEDVWVVRKLNAQKELLLRLQLKKQLLI